MSVQTITVLFVTDEVQSHSDPLAPYPTLAERDAGQMPEPELYEDVPPHLDVHLQSWVTRALKEQESLARSVANRCRMTWPAAVPTKPSGTFRRIASGEAIARFFRGDESVASTRMLDRLTVLDAIINLHPAWEERHDPTDIWFERDRYREWINLLAELNDLLRDCGSAWYVDGEFRGLYRRVDPTATQAWRQARQCADDAGRNLASRRRRGRRSTDSIQIPALATPPQ
ncbi:hypothetical protein [Saccharopolyspora sp. ASAGF58]|uniref:hypothetical protein n=1 Tax=Saccharopolyspora sp. ASAGF58 TaxID=2719023 RepID=UPI00143FC297|nr:hypothetical protein [Saccharopolyspora sp. ASAGF58]QIZ35912.1 hypothetical protein FDZ84_15960 [Saccharopolyspora sp. ASAGF58]